MKILHYFSSFFSSLRLFHLTLKRDAPFMTNRPVVLSSIKQNNSHRCEDFTDHRMGGGTPSIGFHCYMNKWITLNVWIVNEWINRNSWYSSFRWDRPNEAASKHFCYFRSTRIWQGSRFRHVNVYRKEMPHQFIHLQTDVRATYNHKTCWTWSSKVHKKLYWNMSTAKKRRNKRKDCWCIFWVAIRCHRHIKVHNLIAFNSESAENAMKSKNASDEQLYRGCSNTTQVK